MTEEDSFLKNSCLSSPESSMNNENLSLVSKLKKNTHIHQKKLNTKHAWIRLFKLGPGHFQSFPNFNIQARQVNVKAALAESEASDGLSIRLDIIHIGSFNSQDIHQS